MPKQKLNPERFRFAINGREIRGYRRPKKRGRKLIWYFHSDHWPDIQTHYPSESTVEKAVEEFIRRELCR